ncbi:MAG: HEAT repeat domain-containing protein [FCB group bacterium]|nr:HEAT repeat domain-containing protein [FCB group bacterium]
MPDKISRQLQKQASLYVLESLTAGEKSKFEAELKANASLNQYVQELRETLEATQLLTAVKPTEEYLAGQRNLLRGRIEQFEWQRKHKFSMESVLLSLESLKDTLFQSHQPVWAVITYVVIAFFAGRFILGPEPTIPDNLRSTPQIDIRKLISSGALSSAEINVTGNGHPAVNFALETNQSVNVSGGFQDETIRQLLFYLLLYDRNPGNRLKAVKLLENVTPIDEAKMVLTSSLLSDPNPGVRLRAVKLLEQYEPDNLLLDACQKVLLEDNNEAVRMGALNILAKQPTEKVIPTLQIVSLMDENDYIRDQATEILANLKDKISAESIEVKQ